MLRKALIYSFTSNYLSMGVQFVSVMIIARLLTPSEMGAYSIAASFIILAQVLRDFGVSQYIIQEKELNAERIRSAFSLTLIFGWTLSLIVYLGSSLVGRFYETESIAQILHVLSINFLVLPFGAITLSLLRRKMNFRAKLIIESTSSLVRATVAICLAYLGFSYMSLAYASLADAVTTVFISVFFRPANTPYLPGISEFKYVFKTGWKLASSTLLSYISTALPDLVMGKTIGLTAVGYFSRATATINIFDKLITSALRPVIFPYFSLEHRSGNDLGYLFMKGTQLFTIIAWPFFIFIGYHSLQVVRLLYGNQWDLAAPVVTILSVSTILSSLTHLSDPLFTSTGHVSRLIRLYSIMLAFRFIVIVVFSRFGLVEVAMALACLPAVKFTLIIRDIKRYFGISLKDYVKYLKSNVIIAILLLLTCHIIGYFSKKYMIPPFNELLISAPITFLIWISAVIYFDHPLYSELVKFKKYFK